MQNNLHWLLKNTHVIQNVFTLWANPIPDIVDIYRKIDQIYFIIGINQINRRKNTNLLIMIGVSLSRAKMQVIVNATKLDRSKFVRQFKMIGVLCIFRAVIVSMIFCDTPIILLIELKKIENFTLYRTIHWLLVCFFSNCFFIYLLFSWPLFWL